MRSEGGAEPLCVVWWGPLTIVEAARAGAGGGVEGAGGLFGHVLVGSSLHRRRVSTAECVLRHGVKAVRSQAVQLSFRAAPLLRRRISSTVDGGLHAGGVGS